MSSCAPNGSGPTPPSGRDSVRPKDGERSIDDLGSIGSAARLILSPEVYDRVAVELAFVEGREPSKEAIDHLEATLESVAKKPVQMTSNAIPAGDGSYSSRDILELSKGRVSTSSGTTASIWIAYLDGEFSENKDALGVAVAATVAALFPDRIGTVGALLQPAGVERAVLVHEVGHLLALVNIDYQSEIDHEDPSHPHHSKNEESVMHWAVEDVSVANIFRGGPPSGFDDADLADLEMLRSS